MFSIRGIELAQKGFYVNLDKSTERHSLVEEQIKKHSITDLHRFSALTDNLHQSSATKSQRAVFEQALSENLDTIFVAEDDFYIPDSLPHYSNLPNKDFTTHLTDVVNDLKTLDWDVFLFGCCPRAWLVPFTKNIALIDRSTGAWAYLIKKKAYEFILNTFNYYRDYQAIDNILPLLNFMGLKTFTSIPLLIHHAKGLVSTLQPGLGPVDYTTLIEGYYGRFMLDSIKPGEDYVEKYYVERELSLMIFDRMYVNFVDVLRNCLYNLPDSIKKCRMFVYYVDSRDEKTQQLISYFRDRPDFYNTGIELFDDDTKAFTRVINNISTPYFAVINPKHIFTRQDIDFKEIIKKMKSESIDALVFNTQSDDINIEFNINDMVPTNEIPNTFTIFNTKYLKSLVDQHGLFFNKPLQGKIMLNNSFRLGSLNFSDTKSVAEGKTHEYILNRPVVDS